MIQASDAAEATLKQQIQHSQHSSVLLDDAHSLSRSQVQQIHESASRQGTSTPLPEMLITGLKDSEPGVVHVIKEFAKAAIDGVIDPPRAALHRGEDFLNRAKDAEPGAVLVAKEIANGVVDDVTHHSGRVASTVAVGFLGGALTVACAPFWAPEILVTAGVLGAGLAGYEIYKNADEWYHDAKVVSHQTKYSSDEIKETKVKLHSS
jgi:hypothetical protein